MPSTAKILRNGDIQTVRLPREFRFAANEVCIKRIGSAVLLYPKGAAWDLMAGAIGQADDDFMPRPSEPAKSARRKHRGTTP